MYVQMIENKSFRSEGKGKEKNECVCRNKIYALESFHLLDKV